MPRINIEGVTIDGGIDFNSSIELNTVEYLIVAGGGGGGSRYGGGGGAGGVILSSYTYTPGTFLISVGAGGAGNTSKIALGAGDNGENSEIINPDTSTLGLAYGGGGGAGGPPNDNNDGNNGGSGGGGIPLNYPGTGTAGQGNDGGNVYSGYTMFRSAGGGGAGAPGSSDTSTGGSAGGIGISSTIAEGDVKYYGGGGGGGVLLGSGAGGDGGAGGLGGGGKGAGTSPGHDGIAATGGGGGGGGGTAGVDGGYNGGSGVVIIKYSASHSEAITTGNPTVIYNGLSWIYKWTTSGSITFPTLPTHISGLVGWYDMNSISLEDSEWIDISSNHNDATVSGVTISAAPAGHASTNITSAITGTPSDSILWPASVLPSTYTLLHVTRYAGAASNRIYQAYNTNWLSGHQGGDSGQYYHNGWMTDHSTDYYGNDWFITTDQNTTVRTNGIVRSTTGAGSPSYGRLSINNNSVLFPEYSDFQTVECIVYNRTLTTPECELIEQYLSGKYGIILGT